MSEKKVAFVTGASRGIGRAACIALAECGWDVVVTARTVTEGETADGRPLPGSIESTASEVRSRGREALAIRLDLLDSERAAFNSRFQLTSVRAVHTFSAYQLLAGMGKLLEAIDVAAPDTAIADHRTQSKRRLGIFNITIEPLRKD